MNEKYLTSGETARLLNINQATLSRWNKSGIFKPSYINPTGYKYYSEKDIQKFIEERKLRAKAQNLLKTKDINVPTNNNKLTTLQKKSVVAQEKIPKKMGRPPKPKPEKPLFKLYVDSKTGNTWTNYYAMRSGKTNAFCFATNPDAFQRQSQMIDGQVIQSDDDKFKLIEPTHNVSITVDSSELDNITATIAKAVFWIQADFTQRLGHNNPTDAEIEEARFMEWNIEDFMKACGLKDKQRATESMRKMLSMLCHAEIQWQEDIMEREDGKLIFVGRYKDKDGKSKSKVKISRHTFTGNFISTRDLHPVNGKFAYWINKEFANYLAYAGVIAVHEEIFKLNAQRNANAIALASKLNEYYSLNKGKSQATIIAVKNLLKAMPAIPKYEDLSVDEEITQVNGQEKIYTKQGGKGGWRIRILKPFENALEALVDNRMLIEWHYRENVDPYDYEDFEKQYIDFKPNISEVKTNVMQK